LFGTLEFVDPMKNSIVPPSSEFATEAVEISRFFAGRSSRSTAKKAIFAVFGEG
jgi:hypothetical protein